jgi:hypothetical protein
MNSCKAVSFDNLSQLERDLTLRRVLTDRWQTQNGW